MHNTFSLAIAKNLVDSSEQFPVNFELAWQWLEYSRKDTAKNCLTANFIEGLDYVRLRFNMESDNHAGLSAQEKATMVRKENFSLTVDCFKTWAMMAKTEKGKQVRLYFLECEKIAKEKHRSLSPAELILAQAQQLVDIEKKQLQLERQLALESQRTNSLESLVIQHDAELDRIFNANGHYYSIMGYCSLFGKPIAISEAAILGRKASKLCKEYGYSVVPISDPRFGKVNSYPEVVLSQII